MEPEKKMDNKEKIEAVLEAENKDTKGGYIETNDFPLDTNQRSFPGFRCTQIGKLIGMSALIGIEFGLYRELVFCIEIITLRIAKLIICTHCVHSKPLC